MPERPLSHSGRHHRARILSTVHKETQGRAWCTGTPGKATRIERGREERIMEIIEENAKSASQSDEFASDAQEQALNRIRASLMARRKIRSLVMWSGGLDSTYALARLLNDTGDEVYAHHIHLNAPRDDAKARSRRCEFEAQAISRLVAPLKSRYRNFDYSESRADVTAFPCFARETTTAMFFAAQLAMSRGFTPFDRVVFGVNDEDPRWRPGTELYSLRRMLMNRILRAVWESEEIPYLYVFSPRPSKADAFGYLGEELAQLTVSCRHPEAGGLGFAEDTVRPCNSCAKCRSREMLQQPGKDEAAA